MLPFPRFPEWLILANRSTAMQQTNFAQRVTVLCALKRVYSIEASKWLLTVN